MLNQPQNAAGIGDRALGWTGPTCRSAPVQRARYPTTCAAPRGALSVRAARCHAASDGPALTSNLATAPRQAVRSIHHGQLKSASPHAARTSCTGAPCLRKQHVQRARAPPLWSLRHLFMPGHLSSSQASRAARGAPALTCPARAPTAHTQSWMLPPPRSSTPPPRGMWHCCARLSPRAWRT